MKRFLRSVFILGLFFPASGLIAQAGDCPYPIIFLHGWTGSEGSFSSVYNNGDFQSVWGGLADVFHAVVNAQEGTYIWGNDGIPHTNDDDVLITFTNETNDLAPGCLYAINLDNYWNENTSNPQILIHDGGSPSFWASDSNESAIYKQGYALGEMIKKVLAANPGKEKVILMAHSMGGLESREYLQRTDAGGHHIWWVDPNSSDGHKVAKLVTTSTPHRGSNTMGNVSGFADHEENSTRDGLPDLTSEAVRDLRYSYGCGFLDLDDCPGNYLFGGDEDDIGTWFYANADVDCDGDESSPNIIGININGQQQGFSNPWDGTYDNPSMPLPTDIRYTWITSDIPVDNGDGVVAWSRQWLYDNNIPKPNDGMAFRLSDSLLTDESHLTVNSDVNTVLRGLDEGDYPQFAWDVVPEIEFAGMPQRRSISTPEGPFNTDPDWFKFTLATVSTAGLEVAFIPNPNLGGRIDFFTSTPGSYTPMSTTGQYGSAFSPGTNSVLLNIPKGDLIPGNVYYLRIIHNNVGGNSWRAPYRFHFTPATPLPLELLSFSGLANQKEVNLFWTTMNESGTANFDIERSDNAFHFDKIGSIPAKVQNANTNSYTFTDGDAQPGMNYYRLKMIDLDGSFTYSKQISIVLKREVAAISLFPNPASTELTLQFESATKEELSVMIYNAMGQTLLHQDFLPEAGFNQIKLDVSSLSQGLYFMEIRQGEMAEKVKFAVEND